MNKYLDVLEIIAGDRKTICDQEMEFAKIFDCKDSEKKAIDWKTIGMASSSVLTIIGLGTSALGGNLM